MTCALLQHLESQEALAEIRGETAAAAWVKSQIENHKERCMICAGIGEHHLLDNLFAGLEITVLSERQVTT